MRADPKPFLLLVGDIEHDLRVVDAASGADAGLDALRAHTISEAHRILEGRVMPPSEADEDRSAHAGEIARDFDEYRRLSSAKQSTRVTASLARSGALAITSPAEHERLVDDYFRLLEPAFVRGEPMPARDPLRWIAARVGALGGGPRDLLDIHLAALERVHADNGDSTSLFVVSEARLVALELMGLLADYYRVGAHRVARRGT